jgi:hypothetical protein
VYLTSTHLGVFEVLFLFTARPPGCDESGTGVVSASSTTLIIGNSQVFSFSSGVSSMPMLSLAFLTVLGFRSHKSSELRKATPLKPVKTCICRLYPSLKARLTANCCTLSRDSIDESVLEILRNSSGLMTPRSLDSRWLLSKAEL